MALNDIIGQEKALSILRGCVYKNRIPHALFFAGDDGIGKRLTAINFAKALNCKNNRIDSPAIDNDLEKDKRYSSPITDYKIDACDECPSCTKIDKRNHPDVFIIEPKGEGGQITVSAVRQLEESLSYKPFEGKWKIAVIDSADRLNQSAANAFLQTLEEPTQQSILILISSRPDMLLATIRSRCQRINFTPLPVDTMSSLLQEKFRNLDHEQAMLLSTLSGGRLGHALNEDLVAQRDRSFSIFTQMLGRLEEDVWENRDNMEEWFDWGQLLLRDIAVLKATGNTDLLINRDRTDEIKTFSRETGLKDILKLAREIYNIKRKLYFHLNKQLTLNYTSLLLRKMLRKSDS
jgi:DNA polymerase-3 subunit delta'